MGFFDKLFGAGKIKVTFININTGEILGNPELEPNQLPDTFEKKETTMHLGSEDWRVIEATPLTKAEFIKTGALTLKINKVETIDPSKILFTLPTISNELPATIDTPLFHDFEISFHEDAWRQDEFLNKSAEEKINIEVGHIKAVWSKHKVDENKDFNAFKKCHVRLTIGMPGLNINFSALKTILNATLVGAVKLDRHEGFVKNGFALKTPHTTYYGTIENNVVKELAISEHGDDSLNEIEQISNQFDLVFVNWYHAEVIR